MLASPFEAVVGSTDPQRCQRFLAHFGLERVAEGALEPAAAEALYGLPVTTTETLLCAAGRRQGAVRLVATPHGSRKVGPYDHRPLAIDLYTRDIERSISLARKAKGHVGELVSYSLGPLSIREVEVTGPDQLVVVFIEINQRRPSLLDEASDPDAERLHSEVHSIVHTVASAERSVELWRDLAGLQVLVDAPIRGPVISQLMALPRAEVPVRFVLLCDEQTRPARFEVLEFLEDPGHLVPSLPLAGGLHGPAFQVADLDEAISRLSRAEAGCRFRPVVTVNSTVHSWSSGGASNEPRDCRGVSGLSPDGIRFELWQANN